ncbi:ParB N-terminal domain-containing protein [Krasilnikovia sp. MM14-A1004]|uniref:ParB N-terminal domain-containing protein n=1 Tax=Krasilnikovia sp. MM14-A1004 TaxID=3373541 RepID=UPI00399C7AC9
MSGEIETISIDLILHSDSPRIDGEDSDYVRILADSETSFPAILVSRSTMRVIDGMHRLRAARLRGDTHIDVRFFDGDDEAAFVLAVELNVAHGLPLSMADRTAAATRIIQSHPQWSDRVIAATTGLAAKTVAMIRRRTTGEDAQLHSRLGRDGRVRPLDSAAGRRRASELITAHPDASLRAIAREAGISPSTVRDVRARMSRGDDPTAGRRDGARRDKAGSVAPLPARAPRSVISASLRNDPSLRFNEKGRQLLRMLAALSVSREQWDELIAAIPPHSMPLVYGAAGACVQTWQEVADHLARRLADTEAGAVSGTGQKAS